LKLFLIKFDRGPKHLFGQFEDIWIEAKDRHYANKKAIDLMFQFEKFRGFEFTRWEVPIN